MVDRATFYYGQILRDIDLLNIGQATMVGLGKLAETVLGAGTATVGLAVAAGTGLSVTVGPGHVYQTEPLEATAISALSQNLSYNILKQGISLDTVTIPGLSVSGLTSGQSINYLIEVQYADQDTPAVILPFYNASNPPVQWTGPGNTSSTLTTIRKGIVAVQSKAGPAAATGAQTTPSADSGWTGIAVVTLAYGQSQVVVGNIATYSNSTVPITLPAVPAAIQSGKWMAYTDTGTANNYVIAPLPVITSLTAGTAFRVQFTNANTATATLTLVGGVGGTYPLWQQNQTGLSGGYITANMIAEVIFDGTGFQMVPGPLAWASTSIDYTGSAWFGIQFIQ